MRPERRIVGPRQPTARLVATEARRHTPGAPVRVALAQLNTVVGDIDGNAGRVAAALADAGEAERTSPWSPSSRSRATPEDLLLRPAFAAACREALERAAAAVERGLAVIGFPEWDGDCHNAAAIVADGRVQAVYRKRFLPNYGVFDEARYFRAGDGPMVVEASAPASASRSARTSGTRARWPPTSRPGAWTWCAASRPRRTTAARATGASRCSRPAPTTRAALAFCNQVGGQDELVFDGRSALFDAAGELVARAPQFEEHLLVADVDLGLSARRRLREPLARRLPRPPTARSRGSRRPRPSATAPSRPTAARSPPRSATSPRWGRANRPARLRRQEPLPGVLVGLSGGIDSALTAALAADALGPERVTGVAMPSSLLAGEPRGRAGARRVAGGPPARAADRPGHRGLRRGPGRGVRGP